MPVFSEEMKAKMRAPWNVGDQGAFARTLHRATAEEFAASIAPSAGMKALDVACGTGAVAIPLARLGADVTGLDISKRLLEDAAKEAAEAKVTVTFDEGLAEELPYADASFDVVLSLFGIIFSMTPETVISEMARVLKPGGRLFLGNWGSASFNVPMANVFLPFMPPDPPWVRSPFEWGNPEEMRRVLEPQFESIVTEPVPVDWRIDMGPAEAARFFIENAGPLVLLSKTLTADQNETMARDMERLWIETNRAPPGRNETLIQHEYLKVTAVRRTVS